MRPLAWPLIIFGLLALLFTFGLRSGDPSRLPSALIGRTAPQIALPTLEGLTDGARPIPAISPAGLSAGKVTVVNFWASWCAPCLQEHPQLMALAAQPGVRLWGINYKDKAVNARRFLGRHGNPFAAVGVDADGRAGIEWGVIAVPETFIVDGRGVVVYKHTGPITPQMLETAVIPAIRSAQSQAQSQAPVSGPLRPVLSAASELDAASSRYPSIAAPCCTKASAPLRLPRTSKATVMAVSNRGPASNVGILLDVIPARESLHPSCMDGPRLARGALTV